VILEELSFVFQRKTDRLGALNIALTTIDDWHVAQTERNDTSCQNVDNVRACIPENKQNVRQERKE